MRKLLLGLAIFAILILSHSVYADLSISEPSRHFDLKSLSQFLYSLYVPSPEPRYGGTKWGITISWYGDSSSCSNGYVTKHISYSSSAKYVPIDKNSISVKVFYADDGVRNYGCRVYNVKTYGFDIKCYADGLSSSNCPNIVLSADILWETCPYKSQSECPHDKSWETKTCEGDKWKYTAYHEYYIFDGCYCKKRTEILGYRYEEIQVPEPKVEEEFLGCVDNVTGMAEFGVTKTTYYVENCEIKKQVTTDIITKFDERCLSGATPVPPQEAGEKEFPIWIVLVVLVGVLILFSLHDKIQRFLSRH